MDGDNSLILMVDDDDANRYAKACFLRRAGYRVREAMTGAEALHLAITEKPHLVCLDVKLPDVSGIDVCRQIKTTPATLGTLVLQVSAAFVSDEDKIRGLEGGADAYLVMPVEPRELLATVKALLRIRQAEQALRESEERYRLAARATNDAIWDWDLETNTVRWNEALIDLFGWIEPNNCTVIEWWEDRLHPAERPSILQDVHKVVRDPDNQHWQREYRFRRSDGSYANIFDRGYMVRGADGRATRMIGAMLDVTERKRAHDALLETNVALEQGVRERTQELVRSQDRLRALAMELTLTEQRERRRIATEMHDHLAQLLALALMKVPQVRPHLRDTGALTSLEAVDQLLHDAVAYTRTLIADLSPPVLQQFGLPIALRWLGEHMQRHGLHVQVQTEQEALPLPDDQALLLFQSVRELLFNVVKHGHTEHAAVSLKVLSGDTLQLTVGDQGTGFDPAVLDHETEATNGFGLFSIHARLESLRGRFEVESAPGEGTRAILTVPYRSCTLPPPHRAVDHQTTSTSPRRPSSACY
jgi:PAS domain S-box-containing protein